MIEIAGIGGFLIGFAVCYGLFKERIKEIREFSDIRVKEFKESFEKGFETRNEKKPFYEDVEGVEPSVVSMEDILNQIVANEEQGVEEKRTEYQERRGGAYRGFDE